MKKRIKGGLAGKGRIESRGVVRNKGQVLTGKAGTRKRLCTRTPHTMVVGSKRKPQERGKGRRGEGGGKLNNIELPDDKGQFGFPKSQIQKRRSEDNDRGCQ